MMATCRDSIRIACASNRGERLDGHFGSCARFLIYQVSATDSAADRGAAGTGRRPLTWTTARNG
jgi:hypothetical protein